MRQWVLDGRKFLTDEEISMLKKACRTKTEKLIINLGLLAGLRVKEITDLRWSDISIGSEISSLTVRNGKGGKMRLVRFNGELKESIMEYLKRKEVENQALNPPLRAGVGPDDPLLLGRNGGHLARRTVQRVYERAAKRAGISGHSFHHLRHTYASHLYRAGNYNLRLVQKQLGHSSIKTTQVYADVFDEDLTKAVENLYKKG